MANEISLKFGSLALSDTNNITIGGISIKESKSVKQYSIPKIDGSVGEVAKRSSLTITVEGDIAGTDYDDLRTNLDALKAGLQNGLQKFTKDDDRYIMAQLKDFDFKYGFLRRFADWSASFVAAYPFWLSETVYTDERTPTSGVGYTIANSGNAPTRVKAEFTAPGGGVSDSLQMENTTRGELLKYRGDIAGYETLEIDNRYDTDDFQVLNDGVDDHPNFEGDFLNLSAGNNTMKFTGTANVIVKLTYRYAWY